MIYTYPRPALSDCRALHGQGSRSTLQSSVSTTLLEGLIYNVSCTATTPVVVKYSTVVEKTSIDKCIQRVRPAVRGQVLVYTGNLRLTCPIPSATLTIINFTILLFYHLVKLYSLFEITTTHLLNILVRQHNICKNRSQPNLTRSG